MKNEYREMIIQGKQEFNRLERFVEEICDYYNINNEYFGNILLATTEAADILITLGQETENEALTIRFDRNKKGLIFRIRIGNQGNSEEESEDLLETEIRRHRLSKEIYIVRALADEITISLSGRSVVLVFYVSSMNYEKSLYRIDKLKDYWNVKAETIIKK
jgi:phosphopantetheine adenylyltransferase